ncbi:relaxase, partial [Streptomyces sp. SID10244]|nr:relaxase [Streptomyces sp. SID10244]
RTASTEADYARALRAHPELLARPRFAKGSTTEVTGYVVALHPSIAADADGKPIWRNASYLGDGLALKDLRGRWPDSEAHRSLAASAWNRARNDTGTRAQTAPKGARRAHEDARRWERTVTGVSDTTSRGWHAAAADTA